MKKELLAIVLSVAFVLGSVFTFSGCDKEAGDSESKETGGSESKETADSEPDKSDQPEVTDDIDLERKNIKDEQLAEMVESGEIPKNVTKLNLASNKITDISPLSGLTNLTELNLCNNQITDISPLKELTNLTYLNLQYNEITDISSLSGLTGLTAVLNLSGNKITDISPLKGLTNLTMLLLHYNEISEEQIRELETALPNCGVIG